MNATSCRTLMYSADSASDADETSTLVSPAVSDEAIYWSMSSSNPRASAEVRTSAEVSLTESDALMAPSESLLSDAVEQMSVVLVD